MKDNLEEILKKVFGEAKAEANKRLNVLIAGKTGVGKSSLINAVFGDNIAKTGSGKPITQEIEAYNDDILTIFDTKGLEMEDFDNTLSHIEDFLNNKRKQEVSKQIHLAWLCIAEPSRRIEEGERRLYEALKKHDIPTILVITKAEQDKSAEGIKFSDIIKDEFGIDEKYFERVRAVEIEDDEGNLKGLKGINELILKSQTFLDEGHQRALIRKQQYNKELKREYAEKIIDRYKIATTTLAATPIPLSDIGLLVPTQVGMLCHINAIYDIDISLDSITQVVQSFALIIGKAYGIRLAIGTGLKFIPIVGSIAGATINATLTWQMTRNLGLAYVAYLEDSYKDGKASADGLTADKIAEYYEKIKD